jgi:hypothetical protein
MEIRMMGRAQTVSAAPVTALSYKPGVALSTVRRARCPGFPVVAGPDILEGNENPSLLLQRRMEFGPCTNAPRHGTIRLHW